MESLEDSEVAAATLHAILAYVIAVFIHRVKMLIFAVFVGVILPVPVKVGIVGRFGITREGGDILFILFGIGWEQEFVHAEKIQFLRTNARVFFVFLLFIFQQKSLTKAESML
jgi:hypothetical protein